MPFLALNGCLELVEDSKMFRIKNEFYGRLVMSAMGMAKVVLTPVLNFLAPSWLLVSWDNLAILLILFKPLD